MQLLRAINRRGRNIGLQVTISPLRQETEPATTGAIILMDSRPGEGAAGSDDPPARVDFRRDRLVGALGFNRSRALAFCGFASRDFL